MQKNIQAVFYNFNYYIFPEETLLPFIEAGTVLKVKHLNGCTAPNFIMENVTEEELLIEYPSLLFPVKINLYHKSVYDQILANKAETACAGCEMKREGCKDRELNLYGQCYLRASGEKTYREKVDNFYENINSRAREIKDCIDKCKHEKLNRLLSDCAKDICIPLEFFGEKSGGEYKIIFLAGMGSDLYYTVLAYTALAAQNSEFTVIPCLPKGFNCKGEKLKGDMPLVFLTAGDTEGKYKVHIYSEKHDLKKLEKLELSVHKYLCSRVGEDTVIRYIEEYIETPEEGEMLSLDELCERLASEENENFPSAYPYGWDFREDAMPYKRMIEGDTVCPSLSMAGVNDMADFPFNGDAHFAYIWLPVTPSTESERLEIVTYYLENSPSANAFYVLGGSSCGDGDLHDGIAIDFLIFDLNTFYRYLKTVTPVLYAYGARLVICGEDGVTELMCGFEYQEKLC